jgi:hypothetical protein
MYDWGGGSPGRDSTNSPGPKHENYRKSSFDRLIKIAHIRDFAGTKVLPIYWRRALHESKSFLEEVSLDGSHIYLLIVSFWRRSFFRPLKRGEASQCA